MAIFNTWRFGFRDKATVTPADLPPHNDCHTRSASHQSRHKMTFSTLPAEIRQHVYYHIFVDTALCYFRRWQQTRGIFRSRTISDSRLSRAQIIEAPTNNPNILQTCHSCYDEAYDMFVNLVTIVCFDNADMKNLSESLSPALRTKAAIIHLRQPSLVATLDYFDLVASWSNLKLLNLGKYWVTTVGQSLEPLLLEDDTPENNENLVENTWTRIQPLRVLNMEQLTSNFPVSVFLTLVCTAKQPMKRSFRHCNLCHGEVLRYCTILINTRTVFRSYHTYLDDRVAQDALLGRTTVDQSGVLQPQWKACVQPHHMTDLKLDSGQHKGVLDLEIRNQGGVRMTSLDPAILKTQGDACGQHYG